MKYIMALILFTTAPVQAGDLYLDINGYSWHSAKTYTYKGQLENYNSNNSGLGFTYGLNEHVDVFTGFFDNSYYKNTLYGGVKIKRDFTIGRVSVTPGINIGVATGYIDTPVIADYYQVVILPTIRIVYRGAGMTFGYLPRVEKENFIPVSVITAQINIRVGRF